MHGSLIPIGGGDPIPLPDPKKKKQLLIGRRESCDIVLRFANVSAHHCQLMSEGGYWYVRDLQSRNGIKVNDVRVQEQKRDRPGRHVWRSPSTSIASNTIRSSSAPSARRRRTISRRRS